MLLVPRVHPRTRTPAAAPLAFTTIDGEPHVTIRDVDQMPPFFMNIVGNGDAWMFVGSNGGMTAGRRDPDGALFPYQTVDKLLAMPDASGPVTLIRVGSTVWDVGQRSPLAAGCRRHLHKHELGTDVAFEDIHELLGLRFRQTIACSEEFGIVRRCLLTNIGIERVEIKLLDGWRQLLPPGISQSMHERYSYLAAAYARHEFLDETGMMVSMLNAAISDRPEPAESLRVAVSWSVGHERPVRTGARRAVDAFRAGHVDVGSSNEVRGEFGWYLVHDTLELEPGASREWITVADTGLDHAAVVALQRRLQSASIHDEVVASLDRDASGIRRKVAAADGLQLSAERGTTVHHFSNTLFNIMRGGIPVDGYRCPAGDVSHFVRRRSRSTWERHREWLATQGDMDLSSIDEAAKAVEDPQLRRILREYLPIGFSRRHGDPSRPWNRFSIATRDESGEPVLGYAGNWRDLFQNWEALAVSHPCCLPAMIAAFLNASTADGYNPYRVTRDSIDWEVEDPNDPWSHIGYWGDHQIVYLTRLLEACERYWPGRLASELDEPLYGASVVPYRIRGFDDLLADPRHTIEFDPAEDRRLRERMASEGGDAALVQAADGTPRLHTLAEKLLVPTLVKLSNLVPEGGIWLNTQRPEWNDANNALAGWGVSVVTACHLRRHCDVLDRLIGASDRETLALSLPVATLVDDLAAALSSWPDGGRRSVFESLGRAGERHRRDVYAGGSDHRRAVSVSDIRELLSAARRILDDTIRANIRDDGLVHSYNRLECTDDRFDIGRLGLMLEGQVAALSSGVFDDRATSMLEALRSSPLYRADQRSYMLQPDQRQTPFLQRNRLPDHWQSRCPGVAARVAAGESDLIVVDVAGDAHFHADFAHAGDVLRRYDAKAYPEDEREAVLALWEQVFHHATFTGRSTTFFGFEGLGSIYWHMVAKLLLAVQECHDRVAPSDRRSLSLAFATIRDGLGFRKAPAEYGAFPTDAYSHTPRHLGAQQPGMTGQVKEEILVRFGELGVDVVAGSLRFQPQLVDTAEFGPASRFHAIDVTGRRRDIAVPEGGLAFTVCQVPVVYEPSATSFIRIVYGGDRVETIDGHTLPVSVSGEVFRRTGRVVSIQVGVTKERS